MYAAKMETSEVFCSFTAEIRYIVMVSICISNNIRIRGASTLLRAAITKALTVDNPEYKKRKARRRPTWGCSPKLTLYSYEGADLIVPRGFLGSLQDLTMDQFVDIEWADVRETGKTARFGSWQASYELTKEQLVAINKCVVKESGCLVAPAGGGKTDIGLVYAAELGKVSLWITHTKDLLEQTVKRTTQCFDSVGEVGKLVEGTVSWGSGKLIVATVQTLQNNPKLIEQLNQFVGTVVVDECHHLPAACFMEVVGQLKAKYMLGLTATPDRKDGLECYMYMGIGPKLYEIDRAGLYESGRLIKPEIRFVYTEFSYEQASVRNKINSVDAGGEELDYRELLDKLIADEERLKLISCNILRQSGYQIVIADSIPYCHKIAQKLWEEALLNLRIEVVHGPLQRYTWRVCRGEAEAEDMLQDGRCISYRYNKAVKRWQVKVPQYSAEQYAEWSISTAQRKQIMQDAADRNIDILIATGQLVQEGLDLPHLNHGHLVTPKRGDVQGANNGASVEQAIGRIMRVDPRNLNKQAVWWDYVDYNVGVLKSQYNSRRKVYERLQLKCPAKSRRKGEDIEKMLAGLTW
ncbi:MAG: DEAD/DEAH box helicase family protein [Veillonellales bacterium]